MTLWWIWGACDSQLYPFEIPPIWCMQLQSIPWLMDIWVVSSILLLILWTGLLGKFWFYVCRSTCVRVSLGYVPSSGTAGSSNMHISTILSKAKLSSKVASSICNKTSSCQAVNQAVPCSMSLPIAGVA